MSNPKHNRKHSQEKSGTRTNPSEVFESTVRDTKDHCSSTARTVSKTEHSFEIVVFLLQKIFS